MIEGTPGQPFGGLLAHLNLIEANMKYRRQEVSELLHPDEAVMSLTNFPRFGAADFTWPMYKPRADGISCSRYLPDEIISDHPRFRTITKNIRERRGELPNCRLTVFKDINTQIPVTGAPANQPDAVHMDSAGFGMGCCCLQITFQVI